VQVDGILPVKTAQNVAGNCRIEIIDEAQKYVWKVLGVTTSSIEGGDGNKEFLIGAVKL
jgi:predicted rRNA methylase YqxC with S4 and FtsJ domains